MTAGRVAVVKVGTSSLTTESGELAEDALVTLCEGVAAVHQVLYRN